MFVLNKLSESESESITLHLPHPFPLCITHMCGLLH